MYQALSAILFFGHLAVWVSLFNRLHAIAFVRRIIRGLELAVVVVSAVSALWMVRQTWVRPGWLHEAMTVGGYRGLWQIYVVACSLVGIWVTFHWVRRRGWETPAVGLISNHTESIDVSRQLDQPLASNWRARVLQMIPSNQMFELYIHDKEVQLPRLPEALDGCTVVHLSDLHISGKIARAYFEYVIDRANQLDADIVAITGDILEYDSCWDWLPDTVGRLRARQGVHFILGNHDKRLRQAERLRQYLTGLGFWDVGRSARRLGIREHQVVISGNELPWFGPPPDAGSSEDESRHFRILLSHSPDQIGWAKQRSFDLMLAGHTHGGQIRLPWIGPIVCPSRFGVKYACGVFYEAPTLMHVSRGISGLDPLRLNCPPELTRLVLRAGSR